VPAGVIDLDHFPVGQRDRAGGVIHEYRLAWARSSATYTIHDSQIIADKLTFQGPVGMTLPLTGNPAVGDTWLLARVMSAVVSAAE
jgi:hypothetical protein